jgi:hypothetical protein
MEYYVVDVMDSKGNLLVHREFSNLFNSQTYADILTEIISCIEFHRERELKSDDPFILRIREINGKYFIIEKVCK